MAGLKPYRFQEPIVKVSPVNLGKPATWELPLGKRICQIILELTVACSKGDSGKKIVPKPATGMGEIRFNLGNTNRKRTAEQLFGARGLNAINAPENAGTVKYFCKVASDADPDTSHGSGDTVTAVLNGYTYGHEPVLIGSAEDVALQAAITADRRVVARFSLPLIFAEDFRKDPNWADGLALPTGFDDGTILGKAVVEADIQAAGTTTNDNGALTAVAIDGSFVYDEVLAKAGTVVSFSKEKIHQKTYAAGDIELGDQFETKGILQRFSLLTKSDKITKVIVKQGSRIIRSVTFSQNQNANRIAGCNGRASAFNRFDVELDINDDPTTALPLDKIKELSVVATFATANDNPANCLILASYYGPVE